MLFIVTQEPKRKYRQSHVCKIMVVESMTKRGALSMSAREFERDTEWCLPKVEPLTLDQCYRL